jgi:hypothetical protein
MAFLPFAAVGALLASSKKVRKEIGRFAKKVKKKLKKVTKSKVFKVIAAAALIATGVYFVGGMMGATLPGITATGGTAAAGTTAAATTTAGTTAATAAASGNILSNTAAAIVNGARTAANAVYGAGQSTTAFLNEGFNKITGEAGKESVKNTAIDTTVTDPMLMTQDQLADFSAGETIKAGAKEEGKRGFLGGKPFSEQTTVEKLKTTGNVVTGVSAAGSLLAGSPEGAEGSAFAGFNPEGFVGDPVFTPAPMAQMQSAYPLIDFNRLATTIDPSAFMRTNQQLGQT